MYIGHAQGSSLAGDYTYFSCIEGAAQFLHEVPEFHTLSPADQQAVIDELVARVSSSVTPSHGRHARRGFESRGRGRSARRSA